MTKTKPKPLCPCMESLLKRIPLPKPKSKRRLDREIAEHLARLGVKP